MPKQRVHGIPWHDAIYEVYHVNPASFGDAPVDMDTGDAAGDMFFDLLVVLC